MAYHRRVQYNMFDTYFQSSLDPRHRLVLLADRIGWDRLTDTLLPYYSRTGRRAKPIRLMGGLLILKHLYNLSDEQVVAQLHENLYWMYFCGLSWSVDDGPPNFVESSTLTKFRRRIGAEGMRQVEAVIREQLIAAGEISPRTRLIDTTAMEKDIAYPTDSGLLHRGIGKLVKVIRTVQRYGVASGKKIRSFKRVSKRALVDIHKLGKGRKERIKDNTLKLAGYAREVVKVVPQILEACEDHLRDKAIALGSMTKKEADKTRRVIERLAGTIEEQADVLKRVIHQSEERFKGHHPILPPPIACKNCRKPLVQGLEPIQRGNGIDYDGRHRRIATSPQR